MDQLDTFQDKKVLVTGGAGCVGSNLSRRLGELDAQVLILDNMSSAYEWNIPNMENIEVVKGDVRDDASLKRVFKEKPDYVFHLAAHFANQNSVDNPEKDLMVNGIGTLKILQYAQLTGVERLVYSSSGCGVYGLDSQMPFQEHDISISLHTPYQVTKLLGELYTNYFYNLYDLPIVNARFFNVFGPGEVPGKYRNVIPNFFYWSMTNNPLPITGDGSETRDWTYVTDIVEGLLTMAIKKEAIGEAINLGSGEDHKVKEMAQIINELTGNREGFAYIPRRNWDAKTKLLSSIEKAEQILDYQPQVSFKQGLEKTYHWFQENWENIEKSAEFDY